MMMERPLVNVMVESTSSSDLTDAVMARIVRIARLNHFEWKVQLASDGFTQEDIRRMDSLVLNLFDGAEMEARLAATLAGIQDLQDQEEMNSAIRKWLEQINSADICHRVCSSNFPDPIDALASVVRYMINIAGSTFALELIQRIPPEQVNKDWMIESSEVDEGIALAEEGIEEDMAEWPAY